jgi:hypothetical protein
MSSMVMLKAYLKLSEFSRRGLSNQMGYICQLLSLIITFEIV